MAVQWAGFAAGVLAVLGAWMSVIGTLVVPRRVAAHLPAITGRALGVAFRFVARRRGTYVGRDRVLAYQAPTFVLVLLATWIVMFLAGFALIALPFVGGSIRDAVELSGSSFFTLGFAARSSAVPWLTVLAGATGVIVVALQIAYLPVIYGAFNRRELLVTMLDSRAGVPAWGPEILARAELVDNLDNLGGLYSRWEEWIADVAETHTTYAVLIWFRSPHPYRSWITSLLAILDAAALDLATRPLSASPAARVMIRMGYVTLRDICAALSIPVKEDPHPDDPLRLTREDFDDALHTLAHAGWPMERDPDEAWVHFRGWRVNYEFAAYVLANRIDAPPALWSGTRERLPEAMQAPVRPPHREPSGVQKDETRRRREARGETPPGSPLSVEPFHRDDDHG